MPRIWQRVSDWGLGLAELQDASNAATSRLCHVVNRKGLAWIKALGAGDGPSGSIEEQVSKQLPCATNYMRSCAATLDMCSGGLIKGFSIGNTWPEVLEALPQYVKVASVDKSLLESISSENKVQCDKLIMLVQERLTELMESFKQACDQTDKLLEKYRSFLCNSVCGVLHFSPLHGPLLRCSR